MPYGPGLEGLIRQHVPAHIGQGFLFYWFFVLGLADRPWLWALGVCVFWEMLQRERWRRDTDGTNRMPWVENIWDIILGGVGIGLGMLL